MHDVVSVVHSSLEIHSQRWLWT